MDFPIINRQGGQRSVWIYDTSDIFTPPRGNDGWITGNPNLWTARPSQKIDLDSNQMVTASLKWSNMRFYVWVHNTAGPFDFPAQVPLVVTQDASGDRVFLNLDATMKQVDSDLKGQNQTPSAADAGTNGMQIVAEVASTLLGGLASSLGTLDPEFAPAAGISTVLSGTLSNSYQGADVPQPPDLASIKQAVAAAANKNEARTAGSYFRSLHLWFTRKARDIEYYKKAKKPVPQKLEADFLAAVDDEIDPKDSTSFYSTLMYVAKTPEVSKYILSELLIGIGMYIHLSRINLGQTYIPYARQQKTQKGVIPPSEISDLARDVKTLCDGFEAARKAFKAMRAQIAGNYGLSGIPEAIFVMKKVSEFYVGKPYAVRDDDYLKAFPNGPQVTSNGNTVQVWGENGYQNQPDPIGAAYDSLVSVHKKLLADVDRVKAGDWPQNLITLDWGRLL